MEKLFALFIPFVAYANPTFSQSSVYVDTDTNGSSRTNAFTNLNDAPGSKHSSITISSSGNLFITFRWNIYMPVAVKWAT